MTHAHFNTTLDVQFRRLDGSYDQAALAQIRHFFRCREDGREGPMSLRLIELLDYVEDRYHPRETLLVSGYRSPEFNENLRAAGGAQARTSLHTQGLAADVMLNGLPLKHLWQELREQRVGGVGYYRSNNFLHLDTGRPRFWEETTSGVRKDSSPTNANMFLRTDFDRYSSIDGAVLDLHSIAVFPVLVAPTARLVRGARSDTVAIEPLDGAVMEKRGDCYAVLSPADTYRFRIRADDSLRPGARSGPRPTVVLNTCEPRVGKTPAQLVSNEIELAPRD